MDNNSAVWTTNNDRRMSSRIPTGVPRVEDDKNNSVLNNPYLVAVQSKFRRKYYHKVVFAILLVIILILLIAIICIALRARYSYDVCETTECLRSASNLLLTMDHNVDPCEDFYEFTCGRWPEEHPRPDAVTSYDWFTEKQTKIVRQIRSFLQDNTSSADPEAVKKAKITYKGCLDVEGINKLGVTPVLKYLKEYGLPPVPSILNVTQKELEPFDWVVAIAKIKRSLGLDILIGFDIFPDPENRSVNHFGFGTPETTSPLPFTDVDNHLRMKKAKKKYISEPVEDDNLEEEISAAVSAYLSYIRKIILFIIVSINPDVDIEALLDDTATAAIETVKITKHFYKLNDEAENATQTGNNPLEDIIYVTIEELQNMTDHIIQPSSLPIWKKYLKTIMVDVPGVNFENKTNKILTSKADLKYLQELVKLITETPVLNIELYIWWHVVEELILHTTSDIRQLHNEYTRLLIKTEGSTTRSIYCATGVNSLMGMAVSYAIADENFITNVKPKVENMLSNIRDAFNSLVKATNWMDEGTKVETLKKSANMQSYIGFPEWIMNKTLLDKYYDPVEVNETTHLDNVMAILRWQMEKKLTSIMKLNKFGWATAPSHVNAFHTFQANTITVPLAILQFPFYELGLEALNYGAIGTILGHELTHGFDDSGRMFDKSGNMRQWWSNRTITEYINRTACFVKQYGSFYLPEIEEYVNGEITLGENIADNGGLREAYYAYKLLVKKIGKEQRLPGLEKYSHEQLLFIAFGNLWCESFTPAGSRFALEDSHCPGKIRLKGVLSNSPEFSRAFGCKKGSGMYPSDDRCRIW